MRFAVFSDIHSNLEGLQAVLGEADRMGAEVLLCCGDIIGYNADPDACVELVREKGVRCIQGNHERGLRELDEGLEPNMNPLAMQALIYSSENLSEDNRGWLLSSLILNPSSTRLTIPKEYASRSRLADTEEASSPAPGAGAPSIFTKTAPRLPGYRLLSENKNTT